MVCDRNGCLLQTFERLYQAALNGSPSLIGAYNICIHPLVAGRRRRVAGVRPGPFGAGHSASAHARASAGSGQRGIGPIGAGRSASAHLHARASAGAGRRGARLLSAGRWRAGDGGGPDRLVQGSPPTPRSSLRLRDASRLTDTASGRRLEWARLGRRRRRWIMAQSRPPAGWARLGRRRPRWTAAPCP